MTEFEIFYNLTNNLTKNLILFKNNEISNTKLNSSMFIIMSLLLKLKKNLNKKNTEIMKIHKIALNFLLEKENEKLKRIEQIKTINRNKKIYDKRIEIEILNEISEEETLQKNKLNNLINPTLDFYIPFNILSLDYEKDFNSINNENNNNNEENKNKISNFEDFPIQKNDFTEEEKKSFINDLITNSFDDDDDFNNNNFLINENLDSISFTDKKIESSNINIINENEENYFNNNNNNNSNSINNRNTKNNSNEIENIKEFEVINEEKFNSNLITKFEAQNLYKNEFKNILSEKTFNYYINYMNFDYLKYMLVVYTKIKNKSMLMFMCEDKMFLNLIKIFILHVGISDKKTYEDILRNLVYKTNISFENFLEIFLKILKMNEEFFINKMKFLLCLIDYDEKNIITLKQLFIFFNFLKTKLLFDNEIYNDITNNLIPRYKILYSNFDGKTFNIKKIFIILETFFDK
jgi:hypothetical protein